MVHYSLFCVKEKYIFSKLYFFPGVVIHVRILFTLSVAIAHLLLFYVEQNSLFLIMAPDNSKFVTFSIFHKNHSEGHSLILNGWCTMAERKSDCKRHNCKRLS